MTDLVLLVPCLWLPPMLAVNLTSEWSVQGRGLSVAVSGGSKVIDVLLCWAGQTHTGMGLSSRFPARPHPSPHTYSWHSFYLLLFLPIILEAGRKKEKKVKFEWSERECSLNLGWWVLMCTQGWDLISCQVLTVWIMFISYCFCGPDSHHPLSGFIVFLPESFLPLITFPVPHLEWCFKMHCEGVSWWSSG